MKKLFALLGLIAIGFTGLQAQDTPAVAGGPEIKVNKDVHDYGTIRQNADGNCEFIVTNTGNEPLIITRCQGSCGCTVPQCTKEPVAPGETTIVKVKYDTRRIGPINKSVTITSNAVNSPRKVIRIKGTVEAAPEDQTVPMEQPSTGAPTVN